MMKYNKDDAMHIEFPIKNVEKDFEWWYFDAALEDGTHVVVMYSTNDTRLKPRAPSVRLNIYYPDGNDVWECKEYEQREISISYDKCDVKLGEEYCIDNGDHHEIYSFINGNGVKLKFYPLLPGFFTPAVGPVMGWTVAIPHARVEGIIYKDGEEIEVKGQGYHDHNWGDTPMGENFDSWYWGKIHAEDICIDYSVMMPKGGGNPMGVLLAMDENGTLLVPIPEVQMATKVILEDKVYDEYMECEYAKKLTLDYSSEALSIKIEIENIKMVMREKTKSKPGESAFRYVGDEKTTVVKNGVKKEYRTSALHEIVYLFDK